MKGAEFTLAGVAEGHVVAQDGLFLAILLDDGQHVVRVAGLGRIVQLDVGQLLAADDLFLLLDRDFVPLLHVVQVLLHDDVAAALERLVLVADQRGVARGLGHRVFRAVDEAEQVAVVEILEALGRVGHRHRAFQPRHDQRGQLETEVHALGAQVEQQVAGRGGA